MVPGSDCLSGLRVDFFMGRQVTPSAALRVKPGTGIFYNPTWGSVEIKVRPPFSKVWDFSEQETMKILGKKSDSKKAVSPQAGQVLAAIGDYYSRTHQALNLSQLSQITGITSKRTLQELIAELEQAGNIRTCKLAQRGQPRAIEPFRPEVD